MTCTPPEGTADGTWHWLDKRGGQPEIAYWLNGSWRGRTFHLDPNTMDSHRCTYLAPVASPETLAALQAENARLREVAAKLAEDSAAVIGRMLQDNEWPLMLDGHKQDLEALIASTRTARAAITGTPK